MHWLLQVLVRFFWLPIIGMAIYETVMDARVAGLGSGLIVALVTLLVGLGVWAALYAILAVVNFFVRVSHMVSDVNQAQQQMFQGPFSSSSFDNAYDDERIVEGSITEVDENQNQSKRKGSAS